MERVLGLLLVFTIVVVGVAGNSFDNLKFHPSYPPSKHWDVACQRLNASHTYIDIDYSRTPENMISIQFSTPKNQWTNTSFLAYGLLNETDDTNIVRYIKFKKLKYSWYTASLTIPATEPFLLVLAGHKTDDTSERYLTFNNTRDYYNRSECYGLENVNFYHRAFKMHDYTIGLTIHSIFLVPMLIMFILSIATCRGNLAKRRFPTSLIGNVSILVVFVISLIFINVIKFRLYKRHIVPQTKTNVWYNFIQVIGIILGLMIAVTAYAATMLRFFHVRFIYSLAFRQNKMNSKIVDYTSRYKILASRWLFWPIFLITVSVVYLIITIVVTALLYAKRRTPKEEFVSMWTALDVVDIGYLVALGLLLLIYIIESAINIKKFKKGLINFYWHQDPLLYRLEAIIAFVFFAAMAAAIYVFLNHQSTYSYLKAFCFDVAYLFAQPLFGSGIITIIEIQRLVRKCFTHTDNNSVEKELLILLQDPDFLMLFQKYCLKELSSENLELFLALERYMKKELMSFEDFDSIYLKFIKPTSQFEVNIPFASRRECMNIHQQHSETKSPIRTDLLVKVFYDVVANLEDTFTRFNKTGPYLLYKQRREKMKKEFGLELKPRAATVMRSPKVDAVSSEPSTLRKQSMNRGLVSPPQEASTDQVQPNKEQQL